MLWDQSQAYQNDRYDLAIKKALVAAGGTGFTFPACSAATWTTTGVYMGGATVTYEGYIWKAKWYASGAPTVNPNGDWSAISACVGGGTTTTTSSSSSPTGASCANVPAWTSTAIFVGGQQAIYDNELWTAQWWTQGDIPGGAAGVWVEVGTCSTAAAEASKPRQISRVFRQ